MLLVVNTPHNAENCTIRPVFPMVYSDRVITSGFTYTPLSTDLMTNGDFRYEMTKALLWGSQPGWVDPRYLMSKEAEREARFLKTLMDFRRGLHDVLYGGRFLRELTPAGDNPTMHAPGFGDDAAVLASEWQTPDGRRVYLVINRDDKAHKVSLPGAGTFRINGLSANASTSDPGRKSRIPETRFAPAATIRGRGGCFPLRPSAVRADSNGRPTLRLKREASPDRKCRDEERRGKKYAAGDGAPGNDSRGHGKSGPPHHQTCLPSS